MTLEKKWNFDNSEIKDFVYAWKPCFKYFYVVRLKVTTQRAFFPSNSTPRGWSWTIINGNGSQLKIPSTSMPSSRSGKNAINSSSWLTLVSDRNGKVWRRTTEMILWSTVLILSSHNKSIWIDFPRARLRSVTFVWNCTCVSEWRKKLLRFHFLQKKNECDGRINEK